MKQASLTKTGLLLSAGFGSEEIKKKFDKQSERNQTPKMILKKSDMQTMSLCAPEQRVQFP